jgi:hypothetical protein
VRDKAVTHYRFYFLNDENEITNAVDVECDTDEQAVAAARSRANGGNIEIWQAKRKIGVCKAVEQAMSDDAD